MQLTVRSLIDTANASSWMAMAKGDEDPRKRAVLRPSEPQDKRHRSL
jgi:hypothetical protein